MATNEYESEPASKAELIERIRQEYAALEQAIGRLSEEQLQAPVENGWTIKDILAHIAAWQRILLRFHVGRRPFAEATGIAALDYATASVETINQALYLHHKGRPLPEVLAALRQAYDDVLATVGSLDEADLFRSYTPPGRDSGGQLIDWIVGDTYEHYMEHRATIERLSGQS